MDYAINKAKKQIIELVAQAVGREIDKSQIEITVPPEAEMGDLAVPCFYFTKLLRRAPNQIADELKNKIHPAGIIKSVQNVGAYLNFFLEPKVFGAQALKEIAKQKEAYGRAKANKEKIMIEYSGPNTHKEFHIGHVRNVALGLSLVRLHRFGGYQVIPVNYLGDVGSHVAKCLWALMKFHQGEKLPANKGEYLGKIYTEAVKKTEASEKYKKEAAEVQSRLEAGDKKLVALWKKTRGWSLKELKDNYKILDAEFAHYFFESEVEKPGKKIVADLLKQGVAEKSEGAVIVDLEKYGLKKLLVLKSDGSSLYATKDLALARLKFKKYKIDRSVSVTDSRQSFYFEQIFKALEILGLKKPLIHIAYEFVTLKTGAMSSREGNVITFEKFYHQVLNRALAETKARHQDWPADKIKQTAEKIAVSAIKFNMLKVGKNSVIVFDIDEALSFDGFSAPYILYTISRVNSIFRKNKTKVASVDFSKLQAELEKELILKLAEFPEVAELALKSYEPSEMARYLFELAKLFANFYQQLPILTAELKTKQARLALASAVRQVLENGLGLLGIGALIEM